MSDAFEKPILKDMGILSRITHVGVTYHQRPNEQATGIDTSWERLLRSKSRPVTHDLEIQENEWTEVKAIGASYVLIRNPLPVRNVIPTEQEALEDRSRIAELKFHGHASTSLLVLPGESAEFTPANDFSLTCRHGETMIEVTVYPPQA